MNVHIPAGDVCAEVGGLIEIETASTCAAAYAMPITETETVAIHHAGGRTLAEDISAELAMPPFDQSAMDGYAVALGDVMLPAGTRMPVIGRIAAGQIPKELPPGHAARIFTGAPLPLHANAVLMQEHGWRDGDELVLNRMLRSGENIRRRGEDIEIGDHLLSRGLRLDARHIALLSAQGRASVTLRRRPRVGIISTGNELVQPGLPLAEASIYDSNRPMVMTLAAQAGLEVIDGGCMRDDPNALAVALGELSITCDLVVTTGGASVGDEDYSATAVARAGGIFETLKIALKPGKPAVVGRVGEAAYLGLPGNPVSALVSWLILGGAVVAALEGRRFQRPSGCPMPAASRFERRPGRTEFAPGRLVENSGAPAVEILGRGGSARLRPLVEADGLVEIHPLHAPVAPGDMIFFHRFRDGFTV
ncbi:gephyrin-like molybdotransferase Glp [Microvirga brassicacearum]|uniref:Molybdopterin molybdenumtransferase n=1 Tax=Microvirga brassicacearum TaxID=2580413 RepID=A0A5N3P3T5_9HYPH|nr:gephyrin-like molybdotransferase Glp [Microvirga brassicacearum]KAB0264384.1 molybdopterin molybdotransferase MoeA [Microvirga brassicacearum]